MYSVCMPKMRHATACPASWWAITCNFSSCASFIARLHWAGHSLDPEVDHAYPTRNGRFLAPRLSTLPCALADLLILGYPYLCLSLKQNSLPAPNATHAREVFSGQNPRRLSTATLASGVFSATSHPGRIRGRR